MEYQFHNNAGLRVAGFFMNVFHGKQKGKYGGINSKQLYLLLKQLQREYL